MRTRGSALLLDCLFPPSLLIRVHPTRSARVLIGTPAELGKITDTHAGLQITGMFLGPEKIQHVGGFDYLDYEIERRAGLPAISVV